MIHELKTDAEYFERARETLKHRGVLSLSGDCNERSAANDRHYCVGDYIVLHKFDDTRNDYTGESIIERVCFVLDDATCVRCRGGNVVLGVDRVGIIARNDLMKLLHCIDRVHTRCPECGAEIVLKEEEW